MLEGTRALIRLVQHPLRFRMFLFLRLPAAFFSGIRLRSAAEDSCRVSVAYKWATRNPFHSTYFACLAMAAEMSTGILAMMHLYKRRPPVSMLVIKMESVYLKKATGTTIFTCQDGKALQAAIESAIATGSPQTCTALSEGKNSEEEKIAQFYITWSFKAKQQM